MSGFPCFAAVLGLMLEVLLASPAFAGSPRVGSTAADFTLKTPGGDPIRLATIKEKGPVVLVVLRGWPGYQCPLCTRQVGELIGKSKEFQASQAQVLLVYPGPAENLKGHAEEFVQGKSLPDNFTLVVDPDFGFTKSYDLRWEAPGETAYPSTFVIDRQGKIVFAKTSRSHGDRAKVAVVLQALKKVDH